MPSGPGCSDLPRAARCPARSAPTAGRLAAELAPDLPIAAIAALVAAWAQVFGIVSFEVFGQFNHVVEARAEFFDQAAAALAVQIGLAPPDRIPAPDGGALPVLPAK